MILLDLMMPEMDGFEFICEPPRAAGMGRHPGGRDHGQGADGGGSRSG